jgi:hypothetical protein
MVLQRRIVGSVTATTVRLPPSRLRRFSETGIVRGRVGPSGRERGKSAAIL